MGTKPILRRIRGILGNLKGQLISKCLFGVFNSSKKFDLTKGQEISKPTFLETPLPKI